MWKLIRSRNPKCEICKHWFEVPEGEGRGWCDQDREYIHYWERCDRWEEKS